MTAAMARPTTDQQLLADYQAGRLTLRGVAAALDVKPGTAWNRMVAAAGGREAWKALAGARTTAAPAARRSRPGSRSPLIPVHGLYPSAWGHERTIDQLAPGTRFRQELLEPGTYRYGRLEEIRWGYVTVTILLPSTEPRTVEFPAADGETPRRVTFPTSTTKRTTWSRGTCVQPETV